MDRKENERMGDRSGLKGKNAFVTGAAGGIGKAIVQQLAAYGVNVWSHARKYSAAFEEEMKLLAQQNQVRITPVYFELRDEKQIKECVRQVSRQKEPIHILVNNAAMNFRGPFFMSGIRTFKEVYQVNLFSQIILMQMIGKEMIRKKEGVIVNIGSVSGQENNAGTTVYGSSKAAFLWLTKTVAKELAPYGIRVNAVSPGMTDTPMSKGYEQEAEFLERTSLKRRARAEEIAAGVIFLISDESSYVSGEILNINGGRL